MLRLSAYALLGQIAALVAGTANFLLLARALGPADYGVVAGAWALVLAIGPVAQLGADRLIVRDVAGHDAAPAAALGTGLATVALGSTGALLLLLALQQVLLPEVPVALLLALAVADVLSLGFVSCLTSLHFALNDGRSASLISVVHSGGKLAAVVLFALLGRHEPVLWAGLYAVMAVGTTAAVLCWAVRRHGRPRLAARGLPARVRAGASYSLNNAALVVLTDSDKTLLVRAGLTAEAGVYSVAYRLSSMAMVPATAVLTATFPRFFAVGEAGGLPATVTFARRLVLPLGAYGLFAAVTLFGVAPLVPVVVGEQYRPSVALLMLLAGLPLLRVMTSLPSDALTGAHLQSTRTACVVIAAALNVGLNVVLIPRYGVEAAVVTTYVSDGANLLLVLLAVAYHRRSGPRAAGDAARGADQAGTPAA